MKPIDTKAHFVTAKKAVRLMLEISQLSNRVLIVL